MTVTEVDLTIKDLADVTGLTPRMLNIYRAEAEQRLGCKLGYRQGRSWYFRPEEVHEIMKQRESGNQSNQRSQGNGRTSQNFGEVPNFSQANNQAETGILAGMDAIVASGDQNALAIGAALGGRWNNLMWSAALQTMQTGMVAMQAQFEELHSSVTVQLAPVDQQKLLGGNHLGTPALEPTED